MPSPRWLARLIIPVMAGVALVSSAAIATADTINDVYLSQLHGLGFNWPPEHNEALIGMAHLVCDDLWWGWTQDQIAQQTHSVLDGRGVTFGQVSSMVNLAASTYCPELKPRI